MKILITSVVLLIMQYSILIENVYSADRYWVGGTASWDGTAGIKWSNTSGGVGGASEPTSNDNVFFDNNSGTCIVTLSTSRDVNSIDFTGFKGTFTGSSGITCRNDLTLGSGMTYSHTGDLNLSYGGGPGTKISSNGITITSNLFIIGTTSIATLKDDLICSGIFSVESGLFNANPYNVTCNIFTSTSSSARDISMGTGKWTLTGSGVIWDILPTNLNFNSNTSTIIVSDSSSNTKKFVGGSLSYNDFWNKSNNSKEVIIAGSNKFNDFKTNPGTTVRFSSGTTTTFKSFSAIGSKSNRIQINGSGIFYLSKSTGMVTVYFCEISNSNAIGGATWCAQSSVDNGNNTGWSFSCCKTPDPPTNTTKSSNLNICNGNSTVLSAKGSGKLGWYSASSGGTYLGSDTIFTTPKLTKTTTYYVQDSTCASSTSRTAISINVRPSLKAISNLRDTAVCFGQILNLTSNGKGGDSTAYGYTWFLDNKLLTTKDSLVLKTGNLFSSSGESKTIMLVLSDNCTAISDTIKKTITVLPNPKPDFSWGIACKAINTNFQYLGTKPISSFKWDFSGEGLAFTENPSKVFNTVGTKKITLTVTSNSGCKDSITKSLVIKPQAKAAFTINDICETDTARFVNQSQDAESFTWKFGDGLKSTLQSPKHFYNIGGVSKTFNVSLVAFVANGCSDSITQAITVNANPNSDFSYTSIKNQLNFYATTSGLTSYKWYFGNGDSATTKDGVYIYPKSGQYTVCLKVTNAANCSSKSCKSVIETVDIPTVRDNQGFKLYPNPSSGKFTIENTIANGIYKLELVNHYGQIVYKTELKQEVITIDLNLANGVYLIKVSNKEHSFIQRMMINN